MASSIRSIDVIAARDRARHRVTFGAKVAKHAPRKLHSPPSPASAAAPRKSSMRNAAIAVAKKKAVAARVPKRAAKVARKKKAVAARVPKRAPKRAAKVARKKKAAAARPVRRIDFTKIRWGTFTRTFKAWRKRAIRKGGVAAKRALRMKNLKQFARHVLANPRRFSLRLRRKAQFYINIILKGGKRAPRPVRFSPMKKAKAAGRRVTKKAKAAGRRVTKKAKAAGRRVAKKAKAAVRG
jgi:hypothetical protein